MTTTPNHPAILRQIVQDMHGLAQRPLHEPIETRDIRRISQAVRALAEAVLAEHAAETLDAQRAEWAPLDLKEGR